MISITHTPQWTPEAMVTGVYMLREVPFGANDKSVPPADSCTKKSS